MILVRRQSRVDNRVGADDAILAVYDLDPLYRMVKAVVVGAPDVAVQGHIAAPFDKERTRFSRYRKRKGWKYTKEQKTIRQIHDKTWWKGEKNLFEHGSEKEQ